MIGFVILSHNNPNQLLKLVDALNQLYLFPPIAVHHDFSQSPINHDVFSSNVQFVVDYLTTSWGHWSVTGGALKGIQLLYENHNPDWFFLLSAADYPIALAEVVYSDLKNTSADAFLDLRPVKGLASERHIGTIDNNLLHHNNLLLAKRRYMHARVTLPQFGRNPSHLSTNYINRMLCSLRGSYRLPFVSPVGPFDRNYLCYVGSQWFTGNRRAAKKLLDPNKRDNEVYRYYQTRWHADESYVNTILGDDPNILIDINPRRFSRWETGSAHPRLLNDADVLTMLASSQHFARKFTHGSPAIAMIDENLGIRKKV